MKQIFIFLGLAGMLAIPVLNSTFMHGSEISDAMAIQITGGDGETCFGVVGANKCSDHEPGVGCSLVANAYEDDQSGEGDWKFTKFVSCGGSCGVAPTEVGLCGNGGPPGG